MASVSLYRLYRPQRFDEVVGQSHVVDALKQAILTQQINHAYLFCGTRGTGKTTLAKLFARAVNCLERPAEDPEPCNHCEICVGAREGSLTDILEIDAASHNSVETIRRIIEEVAFTPTRARYKVYIIDEAHMLSTGAFNALLKTLEEPPAHALFILATTDPQRIPATIQSRCQRYDLKPLSQDEMVSRLAFVCQKEGIPAQPDALACLAQLARGALRDALSLLDQCRVRFSSDFGREAVLHLLGQAGDEAMADWVEALVNQQVEAVFGQLEGFIQAGQEPVRLLEALLQFLRDAFLCRLLPQPEALLTYPQARLARLKRISQVLTPSQWQQWITELAALLPQLKLSEQPRLLLEAQLIRGFRLQGAPAQRKGLPAREGVQKPEPVDPSPVGQPIAPRPSTPPERPMPGQGGHSPAPATRSAVRAIEASGGIAPREASGSIQADQAPREPSGPIQADGSAREPSGAIQTGSSAGEPSGSIQTGDSAGTDGAARAGLGVETIQPSEGSAAVQPASTLKRDEAPIGHLTPTSQPPAASTPSAPVAQPPQWLPQTFVDQVREQLRRNQAVQEYLLLQEVSIEKSNDTYRLHFEQGPRETYNTMRKPASMQALRAAMSQVVQQPVKVELIEPPQAQVQASWVDQVGAVAADLGIEYENQLTLDQEV